MSLPAGHAVGPAAAAEHPLPRRHRSPGCSSPPTTSPATRSTTRSAASLDFAIIDGMGHGIGSTLLTGLAVGAYRHARRGGASILDMHTAIDQALAGYYDDDSFATGIVGGLAFGTGRLEWSCAGHPPPLLLRGRKVVAELANEPVLPFGLRRRPAAGHADLEPGDAVLLYTDGVTEARGPTGSCSGWTG